MQIIVCVLAVLVIVLFALYVAAELRAKKSEEAMESQRQFFSVYFSLLGQYRTHSGEMYRSLKAVSLVAEEMRRDLIADPQSIGPAHARRWMDALQRATNIDEPDASKGVR